MPRTTEQVLRDYIGDQVITLARMTAKIELLEAELAKYKPQPQGVPVDGYVKPGPEWMRD